MKLQKFELESIVPNTFDTIIDVRSPDEYKEDHIQGAINLPVLSNEERSVIGRIYTQESKFEARKLGAKYISKNISKHLAGLLSQKESHWTALIYCWRGGQRSRSLGLILSEIGWRTQILEGGYKSYRRLIVNNLYKKPISHNLIIISGYTGTGKTTVLEKITDLGGQVINLEKLANHRGSIFGSQPTGQPSQKDFESKLVSLLERFSENVPIFLEAESSKIGYIKIPPSLWQKMKVSPHIKLLTPIKKRAEFISTEYQDIYSDSENLFKKIELLNNFHSKKQIIKWRDLVTKKQYCKLAQELMELHYDPRYKNASSSTEKDEKYKIDINPLDQKSINTVASTILNKSLIED
tara:strand:+ start:105 stop:1160 length:1056 start_codon:yes stop_codon:yes gene_type:complete